MIPPETHRRHGWVPDLADRQIMDPPPGGWRIVPTFRLGVLTYLWVPAEQEGEYMGTFREQCREITRRDAAADAGWRERWARWLDRTFSEEEM